MPDGSASGIDKQLHTPSEKEINFLFLLLIRLYRIPISPKFFIFFLNFH